MENLPQDPRLERGGFESGLSGFAASSQGKGQYRNKFTEALWGTGSLARGLWEDSLGEVATDAVKAHASRGQRAGFKSGGVTSKLEDFGEPRRRESCLA